MANIPIFENSGGTGGMSADIRPTRIGPEQAEPHIAGELGHSGEQINQVAIALRKQQQMNAVDSVQANYEVQKMNAKMAMVTTPFKDWDSWDAQAQKASDFTSLLNNVPGMSPAARNIAENNMKIRQAEFMGEARMMGFQKMQSQNKATLEDTLTTYAQVAPTSNPDDVTHMIQRGRDMITGAVQNGTYTAEEGQKRSQLFTNQVQMASYLHLATDPQTGASLASTFTPPKGTTITQEQWDGIRTKAQEAITQPYKMIEAQIDAGAAKSEQQILAAYNAGKPVGGILDDARRTYGEKLEPLYEMINHAKFRDAIQSAPGIEDAITSQISRASSPADYDNIKDQIHMGIMAGTINPKWGTQAAGMVVDQANRVKSADDTAKLAFRLAEDRLYIATGKGMGPTKNPTGIQYGRQYEDNIDYAWKLSKSDPSKAKEIFEKNMDTLNPFGAPTVSGPAGAPVPMPTVSPSAVSKFGK